MGAALDSGLALPQHSPPVVVAAAEPALEGADGTGGGEDSGMLEVAVMQDSDHCEVCGDDAEEASNAILLCDTDGCERAYHMLCLER